MSKFDEILDEMLKEKTNKPNIQLEQYYLVRLDNGIMSGMGLIPTEQIEEYADDWEEQEKLIAKFTN